MSLPIDRIVSSFKGDFARPNRFEVFFPLPTGLNYFGSSRETLTFRCENASLPARTFATAEQRTYGPIEKFPYLTTYNDLDVTLIVDGDMKQRKIFDSWLELVNPSTTNNFNYRDRYSTVLTIRQYEITDRIAYQVQFINAYPISMNQMDLDWSADGFHKLNVTFAYTKWQTI